MSLLQIQEPGTITESEQAEDVVIGIDLGTTNSLVTIIENDQVKFCTDENGREIHPSIVTYDKNGNIISVGNKENDKETIVISSIKRLMGKGFDDIKEQDSLFEIATPIDPDSADKEVLRIKIGDRKIRPAEISSEILKYLKNLAEKTLKSEVTKAVITVPAYFDEAAKSATKLAANLAGLEVLRLVNEPTAAALAYGLDNAAEGIYCVYDLGGGTFDTSILKMQKGIFKVLGVAGDNSLGGDDFDDLIAKKLKIDHIAARKIKEELSKNISTNGLTNAEFEELISPKINKTFKLTENLIDDLDLEIKQIKGVILVGGSTRIPLVSKKLAEIFGADKILNKIDPDRIVAAGAAWQAHNLSGKSQNLLLDVIPLSLGVEMMGGIVDKIIYRNNAIPTALTKEFTTYADNQTGMKLHIVQGERELAQDCRSLANFEIKNIPAMKAGLARVAVTFKVDADGLLTVSAEEKFTNKKQKILVKPSYGLDDNEVKKMLLDSLKNSQIDIENRLMVESINEANKDIMIIKNDLNNFADAIDENEKKLILEKLNNLEKLSNEKKSREDISEALKELEKVTEDLVLHKVNLALTEKISGKNVDDIS